MNREKFSCYCLDFVNFVKEKEKVHRSVDDNIMERAN